MAFGQRIHSRRKEKGMTLQQLADATGSSKSYIWELESREEVRRPSAEKLSDIAAALGVTAEWLLGKAPNQTEAEDQAFFLRYQSLGKKQKLQMQKMLTIIGGD